MTAEKDMALSSSLSLIAKSSAIVFVGIIFSKVFTYLYKITIARSFDPETFGLFNLALMILGVLISVASLGMPEGLLRFISLDRKDKNLSQSKYLLSLSTKISIVSSLILAISLYFLAEFISISIFKKPGLAIYLKTFSFLLPLISLSSIFLSLIRAFENIALYSFLQNILNNGVRLLALVILVMIGFTLPAILASYVLGVTALFSFSYIGVKRYLTKINADDKIENTQRKTLRKRFLFYSWPIVFLGIAGSLFYWTDSFVIGYYMDASHLGYYNVAFTIVGLLGVAPELFMQLFYPLVVKEYGKKNLVLVRELSKQVTKWILILNIPIFIIMILYPGAIINILFGAEYLPGEDALRILSIGGLISSVFLAVNNNLLSMKGRSKLLLANTVGITLFNLILNVIFVPKYGLVGAAVSTSVSWLIFSIILIAEVKINLNTIPLRRKMIRIITLAILPTLLLITIGNNISPTLFGLAIAGMIFSMVYVLLIIFFGGLDKNDNNLIEQVKSRMISK